MILRVGGPLPPPTLNPRRPAVSGVRLEAQRSIRIILDNRHALFLCDFDEVHAALSDQGRAARILEVGDDVHELGPCRSMAGYDRSQCRFHRTAPDITRLISGEGLQCTEISRLFDRI